MPLPLILGAFAGIAGVTGLGSGINGGVRMKKASDVMKDAARANEINNERIEQQNMNTSANMDKLGTLECGILASFREFAEIFEQIQNKPEFEEYTRDNVKIPKYNGEEIKKVAVGAGVLMGSLGGAALGTAGGFAAAGATTAAVMAMGTASTGTAIASLSGAALTNATLAALGGGAIAVGGGGIALGTTILGVTTLGAGLLVGGVIFNITGGKISEKADEAYNQMLAAEKTANRICGYLANLSRMANKYFQEISKADEVYRRHLYALSHLVKDTGRTDWKDYTDDEKLVVQDTVLLVGLLYKMCAVELVLRQKNEEFNMINRDAAEEEISEAEIILKNITA